MPLYNFSGSSVTSGTSAFSGNVVWTSGSTLSIDFTVYFGGASVATSRSFAGNGLGVASNQPIVFSSTTVASGTADAGLSRSAAGVVAVGNGTVGDTSGTVVAKNLRSVGSTVANLTAAATAGAGARAWVTDATQTFTAANFGATVTGGGANGVPVTSTGSAWLIG